MGTPKRTKKEIAEQMRNANRARLLLTQSAFVRVEAGLRLLQGALHDLSCLDYQGVGKTTLGDAIVATLKARDQIQITLKRIP